MFRARAFVIRFLRNDTPKKLTFKVSMLGLPIYSLKKKQGMQISGFSLIIL